MSCIRNKNGKKTFLYKALMRAKVPNPNPNPDKQTLTNKPLTKILQFMLRGKHQGRKGVKNFKKNQLKVLSQLFNRG
jgi:hypothetical protein